ncbi:MAG: polyhydroxyalkanoate synthesis repressor PhaR [Candidatus Midichloria mitochondrii]|uniref:Putative polyhydroxyalkanoate synthesis repressor PhaR n=2 Tax=Candidatus Midichloria mitochondrii TaxID=234827 RepID=F7XUY9_MIDMI|nr:putative polyhydroxyalkanoate synthesis repressor PhaR [Candidatus Midichloria mitochondrii IricVA]
MTDKSLLMKKYPNRRLYNTATSSYVTLDDIRQLIKRGYDIAVVDVKTGEDLTKFTLTQIALEQQQDGYELLPLEFLKQLIKLQDRNMGKIFNDYIKLSMEYFIKHSSYMEHLMKSPTDQTYVFDYWNQNINMLNQQNINFMQMALSAINMFNTNKNK